MNALAVSLQLHWFVPTIHFVPSDGVQVDSLAILTNTIAWVESLLVIFLWHPAPGIGGGKLSTDPSPNSSALSAKQNT